MSRYDPAAFEPMAVAVEVALLSAFDGALWTLLVQRDEHPQRGRWALPGGFVAPSESLEQAAARVLLAKAGVEGEAVEQLYTFGSPGRDPRMRVITVAYYALLDARRFAALDLSAPRLAVARLQVPWPGETGGAVKLADERGQMLRPAFDHAAILGTVVKRLRGKLDYTPVAYRLLPDRFTLHELRQVHETVLDRKLNKDSFRRRMLASGELRPTGKRQTSVGHRPAELYRRRRRRVG